MKEIFENFDPNGPAQTGTNIFGLPSTQANSDVVIVPVPWEVTTSYRPGTADGPDAVFEASMQVDLYDPDFTHAWKRGFFMQYPDQKVRDTNLFMRERAERVIVQLEEGAEPGTGGEMFDDIQLVNENSDRLNNWVHDQTKSLIDEGKLVALLGGDHSTPYGFIKALTARHGDFGILQIDAHADLRRAYEGFTYSHASIMYNVISDFPALSLVQLGIRDYCDEELEFMGTHSDRIHTFFDRDIKHAAYEGETWRAMCERVIDRLPQKVYISFDIDGLDPKLCPNTGTPVPGGFELEQVFYLFTKLKDSGRQLIGFDLNEVSAGNTELDAIDPIVGARLLYKLCGLLAVTNP